MMVDDADFDPFNKDSWYFGALSRDESNGVLNERVDSGTFFIRDSSTMKGDYVLCVREDQKVSHYIINQISGENGIRLRIGDQEFDDLPALLSFYKTHYLDTTALIKPASRPRAFFKAKYNFSGKDAEDLPFNKDEILEVVKKDEPDWWTARNRQGRMGLVPKPYIEKCEEGVGWGSMGTSSSSPGSDHQPHDSTHSDSTSVVSAPSTGVTRTLPAKAVVRKARIPNAYDETALKLEVGDIVTVTNTPVSGMWEGELNGKTGFFPFVHVELLEESED